ncbi:MAG: hypothetical protein CMJ81_17570 [Planctomycetaceae bacterium]|nr:hypothetical protein [Planctomycetaceae bacterium]MBP62846.1 hypothetical protein [Planctomycetaceae bacterium]
MPTKAALITGLFLITMTSFSEAQNRTYQRPANQNSSASAEAQFAERQRTFKAIESQITHRIQLIERQLQNAEKQLDQQLSQAQRIRQLGLQSNDKQVLDRAESLERQALARYERTVKNLDQLSHQIDRKSQAHAQSQVRSSAPVPRRTQTRPGVKNPIPEQRPRSRRSFWNFGRQAKTPDTNERKRGFFQGIYRRK